MIIYAATYTAPDGAVVDVSLVRDRGDRVSVKCHSRGGWLMPDAEWRRVFVDGYLARSAAEVYLDADGHIHQRTRRRRVGQASAPVGTRPYTTTYTYSVEVTPTTDEES